MQAGIQQEPEIIKDYLAQQAQYGHNNITRRLFLSLVECYKIVFDRNKLNFDDLFEFTKCNSTRADHPYKLYLKPAKCNPYKYSFSIRIVRHWNSLPGSVVEAGSLSHFKSALKRFLNIP